MPVLGSGSERLGTQSGNHGHDVKLAADCGEFVQAALGALGPTKVCQAIR